LGASHSSVRRWGYNWIAEIAKKCIHLRYSLETSLKDMPDIRRIAHLDMDAFYASVELLRYPQLKSLPVVVGGGGATREQLRKAQGDLPSHEISPDAFPRLKDYVGRGVLTTANYEARKFGVGSAMGTMKAAKLCPQAVLLPVDFEEYRKYSRQFKSIITEIAPVMENRGVDEVYIDFTDVPGGQREGGRVLARLIQKNIFEATGLTCSIGVAPNKLLAKMGSEFNKPNGISIVYEQDVKEKIWPLAARKINGIGPKADAKLKSFGIETIGQLAQQAPSWLLENFGKTYGAWMHEAAWGRDDRPVEVSSEPVSMSRETTFERDLHAVHDKAELGEIFTELCDQVASDLQRKGYRGRTIGIKLRWGNFKIVTRDITIEQATDDAKLIRRTAGLALKRVDLSQRFRLLGVRVSKLESAKNQENRPLVGIESAQVATKIVANGLTRSAAENEREPELF
jgi:DNA polymerase IV